MSRTDKKRKTAARENAEKEPRIPPMASALMLSRREVTVAGCRRIIEYGSARIRISVREGEITVEGRGLTVRTYRGDELTVRGWLSGIFFDDASLGEGGLKALAREKEGELDDTRKSY